VRGCLELTRVRYNLGEDALHYADTLNGDRAFVAGDAEEIRAAVSNLLDNAVKYSDKRVQVSVAVAAPDAKHVVVRIADQGIGIPTGQLKRIFNRFYRAPGRFMARVKGTGLGLFIVRSIVKSTAAASLPRAPAWGKAARLRFNSESLITMSAVLIVEDEKHLADGLRFNLEAEGYEVDITGDGESALSLLLEERRRFDAVVLDVMLPGKNGFEIASELRAAGQYVPVLMLTAMGRPEDVLRVLSRVRTTTCQSPSTWRF